MFFSDNFVSVYGKEDVTEKEKGYTGCTFSHCSYFSLLLRGSEKRNSQNIHRITC